MWLFQNVLQWSYFTSIQYKIYGKSMLHNLHRQKFWLIHQPGTSVLRPNRNTYCKCIIHSVLVLLFMIRLFFRMVDAVFVVRTKTILNIIQMRPKNVMPVQCLMSHSTCYQV